MHRISRLSDLYPYPAQVSRMIPVLDLTSRISDWIYVTFDNQDNAMPNRKEFPVFVFLYRTSPAFGYFFLY
jgi:hypothetical protein